SRPPGFRKLRRGKNQQLVPFLRREVHHWLPETLILTFLAVNLGLGIWDWRPSERSPPFNPRFQGNQVVDLSRNLRISRRSFDPGSGVSAIAQSQSRNFLDRTRR